MSAHLKSIWPRTCHRCREKASVTLCNTWNEAIADYCKPHGADALKEYLAKEEAADVARLKAENEARSKEAAP